MTAAVEPLRGSRSWRRRAGGIIARALDNPILTMELRGAFRRRRTMLLLTTLLALIALVAFGTAGFATSEVMEPSEVGRMLFAAFFTAQTALVLLVFPAFSCTSIVEEKVSRSYDLLVTTKLDALGIVLGKLAAGLVYGLVFLIATLPLAALSFLYGGVSVGQILFAYALLTASSVVVSAYALLISSMATSPTRAVTRTFLLLPAVVILVLTPLVWLGALPFLIGPLGRDRSALALRQALLELPLLDGALVVLGVAAWIAVWVSLFLLLAVNNLRPPRADRSTPLRVWFLFTWLTLLATVAAAGLRSPTPGPDDLRGLAAAGFGIVLVGCSMAAVAFSGRDEEDVGRSGARAFWRRLLGPGAGWGAAFVLGVAALSLLELNVLLGWVHGAGAVPAAGSHRAAGEMLLYGTAFCAAFLLALTQLGVRLARWRGGVVGRAGTAGAALLVTLAPLGAYAFAHVRAPGRLVYAFSPATALLSAHERPTLYDRHLVLFSISGAEAQDEAMRLNREAADVPAEERERRIAEYVKGVMADGVEVHALGTAFYALLGAALLALNVAAWRRAGRVPG